MLTESAKALPPVPTSTAAQPVPIEKPKSTDLDPPPAAAATAGIKLSSLHTSPPRPERSPMRPSPSPPKSAAPAPAAPIIVSSPQKQQHVSVLSQIQSKMQAATSTSGAGAETSPNKKQMAPQTQTQVQASPRPAPRNMSNLASIASVLGSPTKPTTSGDANTAAASPSKMTRSTIPLQAIQAARAGVPVAAGALASATTTGSTAAASRLPLSRPGSPTMGSPSRVPVPRLGTAGTGLASPSTSRPGSPVPTPSITAVPGNKAKSPTMQAGVPRVRSPLISDKVSYFQSQSHQKDLNTLVSSPPPPSSPPLRQSSRLAALQSPPGSPKVGFGFGLKSTGVGGTAGSRSGSPAPNAVAQQQMTTSPGVSKIAGGLAKSPRMQRVKDMAMPSPVHKAVDEKERQIEEGEAAGARTKVEEKTASPAMRPLISPVQSPVRVSAKTTVEREILSNAAGAVKVKDFASPAFAGPASAAATSAPIAELQAPMSPTASKPSSKPTDTAPQAISATKPISAPQATALPSLPNTASIPPSPIFSSFLSHGPPNRASAFSFVGLPGRTTGPSLGGAGAGAGSGHSREKSLGLGLGLGLGKSLSAAAVARLQQQQQQQLAGGNGNGNEQMDSQGSLSASAAGTQSFHSALSSGNTAGKKRLSAALLENSQYTTASSGGTGTDSQTSTSSKMARIDGATNASSTARMSISQHAQAPSSSKEGDTKAKFEALRSRISSFKGVGAAGSGRMSSAAAVTAYPGRASMALLASSNRMSTAPVSLAQPLESTQGGASTLFSPPNASTKAAQPSSTAPVEKALPAPDSESGNKADSSTAPPPTNAAKSQSPASTEVQAPLPTPTAIPSSFGFTSAISNSFANLFGMSTSSAPKVSPSLSTSATATSATASKETKEELPKLAQAPLYPSLPSTTGLVALTSPTKKEQRVHMQTEDDEEAVEELVTSPPAASSKTASQKAEEKDIARSRRSSSASVQEIVDAFEAKAAIASAPALEQPKKRTSEASQILYPKLPPASTQPARSTTPEFSPSKKATEQVQRLSLTLTKEVLTLPLPSAVGESGELEIDDPDVEPIARASSVGTEAVDADEVEEEDEVMQTSPIKSQPRPEAKATQSKADSVEDDMVDSDAEMDLLIPVKKAAPGPTASNKPLPGLAVVEIEPPPKAPARPFVPSKSASTASSSTFKPTKPTVEVPAAVEVSKISRPPTANGFNRPISRAPSMTSLAPSRASTISVASSVGVAAALTKSTNASSSLNKRNGLTSSVNGKPEVKSLQMAAQAAKKVSTIDEDVVGISLTLSTMQEQADKERKIAQKEERENKRAALHAAKKDEAGEGEKKRKERDEQSQSQSGSQPSQSSLATAKGKAPMVKAKAPTASNAAGTEEPAKKRKMEVEVIVHKAAAATASSSVSAAGAAVKKTTVVRSTQQQGSSKAGNTLASSTSSRNVPTSSHSAALAASASMIGVTKQASASRASQASRQPLNASSNKMPLAPGKAPQPSSNTALLSQHAQAMSALSKSVLSKSSAGQQHRVAVQQALAVQADPEPEPFALPDIDSEYSDSDDEAHAKKEAALPVWTHSPELRQALATQATFNPDELFGEIPQLRMEGKQLACLVYWDV